ncbi:hypothetical protein RB213_015245 [Colletotrichum asianum]
MEIILPIRKPRENIIPWPPPESSLRPALSGRPGPETIPNDIFIRIIQHTIDDIIAFLETRGRAVCRIEVAKNAAPELGYVRLEAPGTNRDHDEPGRLEFSLCDVATQQKRYRLLRIPLGINHATRKMVHRIFIPLKVQTTALPPTKTDCKRHFHDTVPCLICPQMDKFYIPLGGSAVEAVRGTFCDLLLALQNPRPADTMLLSCVQNITLRHIHYFSKEYGPFIEVLAAFPRLRIIQVIRTANPTSVVPYSPSSRIFEPLPKSHSHDKLEHIKCKTRLDTDGLTYWSKTQGHTFYEISRKNVKIWLATSLRAEPWAELVASPDGPRLAYKMNPCICKTWAPHHMAFRYFFHHSYELRSPQGGFFQKGFYPLGPGGKPIARHGRHITFLVPKAIKSIRDRRLKPRGHQRVAELVVHVAGTRPYIPWDIFILIIGLLIEEGFSYLSPDKPLHLRLQCREKPYVFWPGPCGDLLSFRLYTKQEHRYNEALAQKNRYRALRIPMSICQETRRLVHRRVLQANVEIHTPVGFISPYMFLHVNPGAPEFDENVPFLIFPEIDRVYMGVPGEWHPEGNFMHAMKYPSARDRSFLKWAWFVHRREKGYSTNKIH